MCLLRFVRERNQNRLERKVGRAHTLSLRPLQFESLENRLALATFTVTNLADAPVSGFGQAPGTLRQAIYDANHTAGSDVIEFQSTLGGMIELAVADDNAVGASSLVVSTPMTIRGNASGVTIGRSGVAIDMRLFRVTATGSLTLESISLTSGVVHGFDGSAPGDDGADALGGAIYNEGSLQIVGSTLYANLVAGGNAGVGGNGGSARGGAIYNDGGTISITNSTLSGNTLQSGSGAVVRSAFGGAIFSHNGTVSIHNSTITNNSATTGRGIFLLAEQGTANADIWSTIVGQEDVSVQHLDFQAVADTNGELNVTGSNNLIRSQGGFPSITVSTDDPLLRPLANYGGPTPTHALAAESPTINLGDNPLNLTTDQRGTAFSRVVGGVADIGAFELQTVAGPSLVGDYSLNHTVDAADYVLWRKTLGSSVAPYSGADGDGNSSIDAGDYSAWRSHYGENEASATSALSANDLSSAVQESATIGTNETLISGTNIALLRASFNLSRNANSGRKLPQSPSSGNRSRGDSGRMQLFEAVQLLALDRTRDRDKTSPATPSMTHSPSDGWGCDIQVTDVLFDSWLRPEFLQS